MKGFSGREQRSRRHGRLRIAKPILDGEKLLPSELRKFFRAPPDIPTSFTRSTMIVGSRGAGKTTLMKHIADRAPAATFYISLLEELGSIPRDHAATTHGDSGFQAGAAPHGARVEALLGVALLREAYKRNKTPGLEAVRSTFPSAIRPAPAETLAEWLQAAPPRVFETTPDDLSGSHSQGVLRGVAALVAREFAKSGHHLTILFDRADMLPEFAILPALGLLDQAGEYTAVVATRPAPWSDPDWGARPGVRPGDHYPVERIGKEPLSTEWFKFVRAAVRAQFGTALDDHKVTESMLDGIVYYAHDSIRLALELTHAVLQRRTRDWEDGFARAFTDAREKLVEGASAALRPWQERFSTTVKQWRSTILSRSKSFKIKAPVVFEVTTGTSQPSFDPAPVPSTSLDRFIATSLDVGTFFPIPGGSWTPGARLDRVMVSPLLLWDGVDGPGSLAHSAPTTLELPASDLLGKGGRKEARGKVFVGYRFDSSASQQFVGDLKRAVGAHPMLSGVTLVLGKVPKGVDWAKVIRRLIKDASLLAIGDITGFRGDILFELGVARGFQRPIIPVLKDRSMKGDCPRWLTKFNLGFYEKKADVQDLVASVYDYLHAGRLESGRSLKPEKLPEPVPHEAIAVGSFYGNSHLLEQARTMIMHEAIRFRALPPVDDNNLDDTLRSVARAMLILVAADGTADNDAFCHFASGLPLSRPALGGPGSELHRRVILIPENKQVRVPESLRKCEPVVRLAKGKREFLSFIGQYLAAYQNWVTGQATSGRSGGKR